MDNRQISKKNMYNKLLVFFAVVENSTVWAAFTRLVDEIALFVTKNGELDGFINQQQETSTGITAGKNLLLVDLVKKVVKSARKARVWAHDAGNAQMEALFSVRKDDLLKLAENLIISRCKDIRDGLNTNIVALADVNVTAGNVTAISAAITAAENALGTPGAAEAAKEAGTEGIDMKMDEMDVVLDNIDDLLIPEYEESNEDMVNQYIKDRLIDTVGVRHNGIHSELTYSGTKDVAENVLMRIVELDKTAVSDIHGIAEIIKCKAGSYHVEFSGAAIVTKVLVLTITRGSILNVKVEVVRS